MQAIHTIKRPHTFLYDWFHYHDFDSCVDLTRHQVSQAYLEEHLQYLNWDTVSAFQVLTEEFLERYSTYVKWDILLQQNKPFLSSSFINKKTWTGDEWKIIITQYKLTPSQIREKLNCYPRLICQYQRLNEKQIRDWITIYPEEILLYQQLSPSLLIEYKDLFYERDLIQYQEVPYKNLQLTESWNFILINQELDESEIESSLPIWDSEPNWRNVSKYQEEHLSQEFLCKYSDKIWWHFISCTQLDEEMIELYADKINWKFVSKSNSGRVFSIPFLERWKDRIYWDLFLYNQYTMDQLESIPCLVNNEMYFTKDVWKHISLHHHLSEEFIERNIEHLRWYIDNLCKNKFITGFTESFMDKYIFEILQSGTSTFTSTYGGGGGGEHKRTRHANQIVLPLNLLHKHKRILMKEPNSIASSFRINCMIRKCQRSFIERLYHPDSTFIQCKMNALRLL